ncbi:MAG: tetraacyldisaccharide 4'-kinase, partial [Burkholderiaceae bacterium]|nr:tetraacyldisaccharide 4'-kinase [Burkholderiaceae bacterium]
VHARGRHRSRSGRLAPVRPAPVVILVRQPVPQDFFAMLQAQGLALAHTQGLPDHSDFDSWQRPTDKPYSLICTEKDAVKLWHRHPDALAVPLQVQIDGGFFVALDARLATARSLSSPS